MAKPVVAAFFCALFLGAAACGGGDSCAPLCSGRVNAAPPQSNAPGLGMEAGPDDSATAEDVALTSWASFMASTADLTMTAVDVDGSEQVCDCSLYEATDDFAPGDPGEEEPSGEMQP